MAEEKETKKENKITGKQIFAWIGIGVIALWFIATACLAVFPIPGKDRLFPFFMIGCIVFPVFIWIGMWIYGAVTGKKNVASFRTEEMEETMRKAEEIRREAEKESESDSEEESEEQ